MGRLSTFFSSSYSDCIGHLRTIKLGFFLCYRPAAGVSSQKKPQGEEEPCGCAIDKARLSSHPLHYLRQHSTINPIQMSRNIPGVVPKPQQPKALLAVLLTCLKAPPFRHLKQKTQGGKRQKSKKIKNFISLFHQCLSILTPFAISPYRTKNAGSSQSTEGLMWGAKGLRQKRGSASCPIIETRMFSSANKKCTGNAGVSPASKK